MRTKTTFLTLFLYCFTLSLSSAQERLPYPIEPGQPISASGLTDNFFFLIERIQALEEELLRTRSEAAFLQEKIDSVQAEAFRGAVVAFNRSEKDGACPIGWRYFEPAAGRFVVGAGRSANADGSGVSVAQYPSYTDDPQSAVGGEATVTLTERQVPRHVHALPMLEERSELSGSSYPVFSNQNTHPSRPGTNATLNTQPAGGSSPHNNLPPYIALYYCIFDG